MDVWIVSESDALAASLRKSLARLNVDCPMSHVVSADSIDQASASWIDSGQVVLFAVRTLLPHHIEAVRSLRAGGERALAVVSALVDHATVLQAIRAGASDVLNANGALDEEIGGFLARLQLERRDQATKGRLITVVPSYAPEDGNTLSVNLAAVIAQRAGRCALLDLHLRGGVLELLLKVKPRHTVLELLKQRHPIDEAMFQQALTPHDSGIRLLAGPPLFSDLRGIEPQVFQRLLSLALATHPFVVVNSEDAGHEEQIKALASSDHVVLTMRPEIVSLYRAKRFVEFMTLNHVDPAHMQVMAMGTGLAGEIPLSTIKKILNVPSVHAAPDDPTAATMAANVGNPLVLEAPKSKASRAIVKLAESLMGCSSEDSKSNNPRTIVAKAATLLAVNSLT